MQKPKSRSNCCRLTLEMTRHLPVAFHSSRWKISALQRTVLIGRLAGFQRPVIIGLLLVLHQLIIRTGTLVLVQLKQQVIHSSLLAANFIWVDETVSNLNVCESSFQSSQSQKRLEFGQSLVWYSFIAIPSGVGLDDAQAADQGHNNHEDQRVDFLHCS